MIQTKLLKFFFFPLDFAGQAFARIKMAHLNVNVWMQGPFGAKSCHISLISNPEIIIFLVVLEIPCNMIS